jgi:hypothetical protein
MVALLAQTFVRVLIGPYLGLISRLHSEARCACQCAGSTWQGLGARTRKRPLACIEARQASLIDKCTWHIRDVQ